MENYKITLRKTKNYFINILIIYKIYLKNYNTIAKTFDFMK